MGTHEQLLITCMSQACPHSIRTGNGCDELGKHAGVVVCDDCGEGQAVLLTSIQLDLQNFTGVVTQQRKISTIAFQVIKSV